MRQIHKTASKLAALSVVLMLVFACQKERCREEDPSLTFIEYIYQPKPQGSSLVADTLIIRFAFEDCQGDVGLFPPLEGRHNLKTRLYEWINGEWHRFEPENPADSNLLFAAVPTSPKVREGSKAEGFIEQRFGSIRQNSDTIRFETILYDRAGNSSEHVTTPTYIVPK